MGACAGGPPSPGFLHLALNAGETAPTRGAPPPARGKRTSLGASRAPGKGAGLAVARPPPVARSAEGGLALVFTDWKVGGARGMDVLRGARQRQPEAEVILLTA